MIAKLLTQLFNDYIVNRKSTLRIPNTTILMRDTIQSSDHLSRFIHRIYEIKESHSNLITQNDLKAAAKEMGVTDREWVKLQDLFSSHLARAIGYHKYKNWDDAIHELDQALTIYQNLSKEETFKGLCNRVISVAKSKTIAEKVSIIINSGDHFILKSFSLINCLGI